MQHGKRRKRYGLYDSAREKFSQAKPVSWWGAAVIVDVWLALAALSVILIFRAV